MATLIDGKAIAKQIEVEVTTGVQKLKHEHGITPGLAVVLVGDNPASKIYVGMKGKACVRLGMNSFTETLSAATSETELLHLVDRLNSDPSVHGILVQLPLPSQIRTSRIIETIHPSKDVDGLHPYNIGLLCSGHPGFIPCTPYGIVQLLMRSQVKIAGSEVVVAGRSNLVGRPIANLLSMKSEFGDATVTICHSRTRSLPDVCKRADILIAAMGQKRLINRDYVKPGVVIIDVGTHRLSEEEGGGTCGDVDFHDVCEIASKITPVPGGVGPMTIAMLMKNTLEAAEKISRGI